MIYFLFILSIALVGIAGLQCAYLAFLEASNRQLKKRISELEQRLRSFSAVSLAQHGTERPRRRTSTDEHWPEYLEHDH